MCRSTAKLVNELYESEFKMSLSNPKNKFSKAIAIMLDSLALSSGQPCALTSPNKFGHKSNLSGTPSLSKSGQPLANLSPATSGHKSYLSSTPSLSLSNNSSSIFLSSSFSFSISSSGIKS